MSLSGQVLCTWIVTEHGLDKLVTSRPNLKVLRSQLAEVIPGAGRWRGPGQKMAVYLKPELQEVVSSPEWVLGSKLLPSSTARNLTPEPYLSFLGLSFKM